MVPSGPQEPSVLLLLRDGDGGFGLHQDASRRLPLTTPAPGGEGEESMLSHYIGGLLVSLSVILLHFNRLIVLLLWYE